MIPPMMLAHLYDDEVDPTGWWMSEKLDGIRAWWDGSEFWTKSGNRIAAPSWYKKGMPRVALDGELWAGRGRFAEVSSTARMHEPGEGWGSLSYAVFDVPIAGLTIEKAQEALRAMQLPGHVVIVGHHQCANPGNLAGYLNAVVQGDGEGLMIRKPGSVYAEGRSHSLLKVKPYKDAEAVVLSYEPGEGKHLGRVGALWVEANGIRFKIGTGLTDADREKPPAIGALVTYRYTELLPSGKPRHARFLRERLD